MRQLTKKEYAEIYESDGYTGLPKCKCCGRIDTDFNEYNEVIDE
mgnify:CR=1 FL=1|tara:strand:+ start:444 stop:575 length:132 start_codon:yes stop_codon:yes gene_type:complete